MRKIDLLLWMLTGLVLVSTIGFGVYYYFDRYSHSNQSVVQHQIQNVEALVRQNPQNPQLRVAVANYYLEGGMPDQAIQQAQQALSINAKDQNALVLLGNAYQKMGNVDGAIAQFELVIELNKDNPLAKINPQLETVNYQLGVLYSQQQKYAQATTALKRALEINGTDADAHFALGIVYQNTSDYSSAIKEFAEALRYTPDFVEAYEGIATNAAAMGDATQAKYARAMVALYQGNSAAAATQLEELVTQAPSMKQAYYGLGIANERLGRRDQAIQALQEFVKTNPNDIAAQQALGRVSRGN
ncbi:MAG: tetratricopeptide repeat protein [Chloroflexi bacterium]|nr:tetratricopeptide repeat protein [Chloroflexota bacterium]